MLHRSQAIQTTYKKTLARFVPPAALEYCYKLWLLYQFDLHISHRRETKLGDFTFKEGKRFKITVNGDMNPSAFLVTYLHEVAHLVTFVEHQFKAAAHGTEWKDNFRKLAAPLMNEQVFPPVVLNELRRYFKNPSASSCSDMGLMKVMHSEQLKEGECLLSSVNPGEIIVFKNEQFRVIEHSRTRVKCLDLQTEKLYLIHKTVVVNKITLPQQSLHEINAESGAPEELL